MAYIKHFREVRFRVPDPTRPGHSVFDLRMDGSKTHAITHNGVAYEADSDGWFDLPPDVAAHFLGFPGWCSPEMVDEEVVAGRIRADASDLTPSTREQLEKKAAKPRAQRKKAGAATASS
jgi:hypothetical protein